MRYQHMQMVQCFTHTVHNEEVRTQGSRGQLLKHYGICRFVAFEDFAFDK